MRKPKNDWYICKYHVFNFIPKITINELLWKDKWDSPRVEQLPSVFIRWLWWELGIISESDQYYEQTLWKDKYCDGDLTRAKYSWPWINPITKLSTWIDYE